MILRFGDGNERTRLVFLFGKRVDRWLEKYQLEDTVRYQIVHLINERLARSGALFNFHGKYVVDGKNRQTFSKYAERRQIFAFEDLSFPRKDEFRVANLAILRLGDIAPKFVEEALASIKSGPTPNIVSTRPIVQLSSRMQFYQSGKKTGSINLCSVVNVHRDAIKSKFVVIDQDGGEDATTIGRKMRLNVQWVE